MMGRGHFIEQADYWNSVINPDNITVSELNPDKFDLEKNISFYRTPIQDYAYSCMGDLEGKDVLELGCGMGLNAVLMARRGANVTAIDIAQKRVDWVNNLAKRHGFKNIRTICMSAEELQFPVESFDIIYSNEVLIHLDCDKALPGCAEVMRKGGKAIFIESLKFNPLVNLYRFTLAPKIFRRIGEHFTLEEINSFHGFFSKVKHREFYLFSFLAFFWQFGLENQAMFRHSLKALNKIDQLAFRFLPFMRCLGWMSCIECIK